MRKVKVVQTIATEQVMEMYAAALGMSSPDMETHRAQGGCVFSAKV